MHLNDAQKEAVEQFQGPMLILAGAGSGKTTVLTERISHMVSKHGVTPSSILAVTFTNKAAGEMRERIIQKLPMVPKHEWQVFTFHSFCVRVLREWGNHLALFSSSYSSSFTILDEKESRDLFLASFLHAGLSPADCNPHSLYKDISLLKSEACYFPYFDTHSRMKSLILSERLNELFREKLTEKRLSILKKAFHAYQSALSARNALDFDDLIFFVNALLLIDEDVKTHYQEALKYFLVDEYQDTNYTQYLLMKQLAAQTRNLTAVGDDNQSIYAFRGSDIRNILHFDRDYPDAAIVKLEQNYRCAPTILQIANEVIAHNENQHKKVLLPTVEGDEKVYYYEAMNDVDEARYIVGCIQQNFRDGALYQDHAILVRANHQKEPIEEALLRAGIPFHCSDSPIFLAHPLVKGILRKASDSLSTRKDDDAIDVLTDIIMGSDELRESFFLPPSEEESNPLHEYFQFSLSMRSDLGATTLQEYMDYLSFHEELDEKRRTKSVTIMSIHASKGMEFPRVFLPGLEEGLLPHKFATTDKLVEEERRLFYVGVTRAKMQLHLTHASSRRVWSKTLNYPPSRFLLEFHPSHLHPSFPFLLRKNDEEGLFA